MRSKAQGAKRASPRRSAFSVVALALLLLALTRVALAAEVRRATVDAETVATYDPTEGLFLEILPRPREGLLALAKRLCGSSDRASDLVRANDGSDRLLRGIRYRIPQSCLSTERRLEILERLFPGDDADRAGWRHRVAGGVGGVPRETLWRIAETFTGRGANYVHLRTVNQLVDETVEPGQSILIPEELLLPVFRSGTRTSTVVGTAASRRRSADLDYGRDSRGEYAVYRLRPGEALYTSVVVRFTGRLFAADVNPLASEIAERSGIDDVTDIPVGYEVKIPFDYLSPEYLPADHPDRVRYDANRDELLRYENTVQARDLEGVVVVLDAGHGGRDVGASTHGVWESLYVYDIMLRTKRLLEQRTAARVRTTTRDGEHYRIVDRDVLPYSKGHEVLTDPPYAIEQARIGTNLRWYLANDILRRERPLVGDPNKVVYVSIHADSLHPQVRGAMVYVPGLLPIPTSYGKTGVVYSSRAEVRSQPRVSFNRGERVESEGLSRDLAQHIIQSFARGGLAIHPNKPVRDRIVRRRGTPWVPAVLRYNEIPTKVLVEVCNLANAEDRRLIQTRRYRERVAETLVDGLLEYYGHGRLETTTSTVAESAR